MRALGLVWVGALAVGLVGQACSDVGDSSAVPGGDASASEDAAGAGQDGALATAEAGPATGDSSFDAGAVMVDAPPPDDTSVPGPDGASGEAGSVSDTGVPDVAVGDATVDAGLQDAGADSETSGDGAVSVDAATDAAGDAGTDAGGDGEATDSGPGSADAGGPLVPCTVTGQTGCVQCQFNDGEDGTLPNTEELCTPTEAVLVSHDIAAKLAVAPGPDPDGSCYACAAENGCLDDSEFADKGFECEDIAGAAGVSACGATVACILQSSCASTELSACYCGTAPVSGACAAVGGSNGANGVCKATEAAGLGYAANDGLDVLKSFNATTLPSGVANNIFQCATSNNCAACLH